MQVGFPIKSGVIRTGFTDGIGGVCRYDAIKIISNSQDLSKPFRHAQGTKPRFRISNSSGVHGISI